MNVHLIVTFLSLGILYLLSQDHLVVSGKQLVPLPTNKGQIHLLDINTKIEAENEQEVNSDLPPKRIDVPVRVDIIEAPADNAGVSSSANKSSIYQIKSAKETILEREVRLGNVTVRPFMGFKNATQAGPIKIPNAASSASTSKGTYVLSIALALVATLSLAKAAIIL